MAVKFSWRCPYCGHHAVIHDEATGTYSEFRHEFNHGNRYGFQAFRGIVIVCPNDQCGHYTIKVFLHDHKQIVNRGWVDINPPKREWRLMPDSDAQVFPDYIPEPILNDYREACLIRDFSPKASATLSRRCLQGIIRDFWGVSKSRLVDEIEAIKEKIDIETWDAINSVRLIGNIGAHMEKDINLIVDVDPDEAQVLIELIETLFTEWYINRHERQQRMGKVKAIATTKCSTRKSPGNSVSGAVSGDNCEFSEVWDDHSAG